MIKEQVERLVGKQVMVRVIVSGSFVINLVGKLERSICPVNAYPYSFSLVDDFGFVQDCAFSLKDVEEVRDIAHFIRINVKQDRKGK